MNRLTFTARKDYDATFNRYMRSKMFLELPFFAFPYITNLHDFHDYTAALINFMFVYILVMDMILPLNFISNSIAVR